MKGEFENVSVEGIEEEVDSLKKEDLQKYNAEQLSILAALRMGKATNREIHECSNQIYQAAILITLDKMFPHDDVTEEEIAKRKEEFDASLIDTAMDFALGLKTLEMFQGTNVIFSEKPKIN